MQLKVRDTMNPFVLLCRILLSVVDYRIPKRVTEVMVFRTMTGETGYFVCPRCRITLERECMSYCDRCGQCLDWTDYEHARIIYPYNVVRTPPSASRHSEL